MQCLVSVDILIDLELGKIQNIINWNSLSFGDLDIIYNMSINVVKTDTTEIESSIYN